MLKRFAAILLVIVMVIGVFSVSTMAENGTIRNIRNRAYLQLDDYESNFNKVIGLLGNDEAEGVHINYVYNAKDQTEQEVLDSLKGNSNNEFLGRIESPNPEIFTKVETILLNGKDRTEDFLEENGEFPGGLDWLNYVDTDGNLRNASETYTVVWTDGNETEPQTRTDNFMISITFPQVSNEGGGDDNGNEDDGPANSGDYIHPEEVTAEKSDALKGVICEYDSETGVFSVTISENKDEDKDLNDWKAAYIESGMSMSNIYVDAIIKAPSWATKFYSKTGNGDSSAFENFKQEVKENGTDYFYNVNPRNPYGRYSISIAHISRNTATKKVTITPVEENLTVNIAWLADDGNITYQTIDLKSIISDGVDGVTFDDPFADIKFVPTERVVVNDTGSTLMTKNDENGNLNYADGTLTLTYIGEGKDYDSVKENFNAALKGECGEATITVQAPKDGYVGYRVQFDNGDHYPKNPGETLPVWGTYFDGEILTDEEYYLYWMNENDSDDVIVEKISIAFKFPFKNLWMEKYWKALEYSEEESSLSRLKFTVGTSHATAEVYTLSELEKAGAKLTVDNGYITVSFTGDNPDIYVITNIIAQIDPPEGAAYYRRLQSTAEGITDYGTADNKNISIQGAKRRSISQDGKPRIDLSGFEPVPVNGLNVWVSTISGITRVLIIDWYDENDKIIQRDYLYTRGDDYCWSETASSVSELEEPVKKPTPVDDEYSWSLTTNHFAQEKQYDDVNAYYFQLEGDENTPDDEKVIYLPYSFIDENLTYEQAVEMGLQVKIYHYKDDHIALVEGAPLDGELREEGIRFVVNSFSPFVLEWSSEEPEDVPENVSDNKTSTETVTITISGYKTQESEENPNTDAEPMLAAAAAIAAMSCAAIFVN